MSDQDVIQELLKDNNEELKISEKQVKILEAAIEIFSEKGFAATSTSEIAKKAGVAEGTIFRHYKTKKDLLLKIITPTMLKVATNYFAKNIVKEVFDNHFISYEDFLRALIKNRFQFVKKHLLILKIVLQEIAFHPELKEQFQKVIMKHVFEKFVKIIEYFQERGEIVPYPPKTVIRITTTNIIGLIFTRIFIYPDDVWDDEKEIDYTVQFIMQGLAIKND
jgi:AcrR family transcriptional regulator